MKKKTKCLLLKNSKSQKIYENFGDREIKFKTRFFLCINIIHTLPAKFKDC